MQTPAGKVNKDIILYYGVCVSAIRMLVGGISSIYLYAHSLSYDEIGWLKAFQAVVILTLDIPLSYSADKVSRTFSIKMAVLSSALWLFMMGYVESFTGFLVAEFFNALSLALFNGAFIACLLEGEKKKNHRKILSHYSGKQHFFMAFVALIGPFFLQDITEGFLWYISSICMLVLFSVSVFIFREDQSLRGHKKNFVQTIKSDFLNVYSCLKRINILLLISLLVGVFYQISIQYWQPVLYYFAKIGVKGSLWGFTFFIILISQSISAYFVNKRFFKTFLFSILMCFFIIKENILFFTPPKYFYILLTIMIFMIIRFFIICISSRIQSLIDDELRATANAIVSTVNSIILFLALPAFGYGLSYILQ